ncbi:MAG: hypothetical protein WA688_06775, partial [Thermoplasmata archaeon]
MTRRALRLGGPIFAGAACLSAGLLGLGWSLAPALLRNFQVDLVLLGAGILVLPSALLLLALDRWKSAPTPRASPAPVPTRSTSGSSLMALPAIVREAPAVPEPLPPSEPAVVTPFPIPTAAGTPAAVTAVAAGPAAPGPASSTLLIPFAEEPASPIGPPVTPFPAQTVSRLVDRMDVLQRVTATNPSPTTSPAPPSDRETVASDLLLRLTRIPTPPAASTTTLVARRCNDCGDPLGAPPQFEPCDDCGRALCERCYWRTASGPAAHLCTVCL